MISKAHFKPSKDLKEHLDQNQVVLFGSFTRKTMWLEFNYQSFYFENIETGARYNIHGQFESGLFSFSTRTPDDFTSTTANGAVFMFVLPAGKYRFNNFYLSDSMGNTVTYVSPGAPYSIPFEVLPNTANYIGEIRITPLKGKNLFGGQEVTGGIWHIINKKVRDAEILKKKFPDIPVDSISVIIPTEQEIPSPNIVLPSRTELRDIQNPKVGESPSPTD